MSYVTNTLSNLIHQTAFFNLTWGNYMMILAVGSDRFWYASGKYLSGHYAEH